MFDVVVMLGFVLALSLLALWPIDWRARRVSVWFP